MWSYETGQAKPRPNSASSIWSSSRMRASQSHANHSASSQTSLGDALSVHVVDGSPIIGHGDAPSSSVLVVKPNKRNIKSLVASSFFLQLDRIYFCPGYFILRHIITPGIKAPAHSLTWAGPSCPTGRFGQQRKRDTKSLMAFESRRQPNLDGHPF